MGRKKKEIKLKEPVRIREKNSWTAASACILTSIIVEIERKRD